MKHSRPTLRMPVGLTVIALVLSACGGGGSDEADPAPSSSAAAPTVESTAPAAPVTPALVESELQAVPLQLSELPRGWSEASTEDEENDSTFEGDCGKRFEAVENNDLDANPRVSKAEVAYARGGNAELDQQVTSLPSDVELGTGFDDLAALIRDCPEVVLKAEGEEIPLRLGRTSFPSFGDESLAYTATADVEGFTFSLVVSLVRIGNSYVSTTASDIGGPDLDLMETAVRTATTRLKAVSGK